MTVDLFVPVFLSSKNLCNMFYDKLSTVEKNLACNILRSLFIYELVKLLAFVKEEFGFDVALAG